MNMKIIPSIIASLVIALSASYTHAAIQNSLADANTFMVAGLEQDSPAGQTQISDKFDALNSMIEPAAGDAKDHAEKMHDAHHKAAHDAHYDDKASGGLPQFDPSSFASQLFWLAITFIIMYVFFAKKALPDIASSLDARETRIKTDIESAEKINEQAETVKTDYEKVLQDSKDQSTKIISAAHDDLKNKSNEAIDAFRKNQEKVLKDLESKITAAKDDALSDMHTIAADAAQQAAQKIIDVDADIKAVKSVVEKLDKAA